MLTTAPQSEPYNAHEPGVFMAFELSEKTWQLGFTTGHGQPAREHPRAARDTQRLLNAVAPAKVWSIGNSNGLFHCLCPPAPRHLAPTGARVRVGPLLPTPSGAPASPEHAASRWPALSAADRPPSGPALPDRAGSW
jgi:hypothetical protein